MSNENKVSGEPPRSPLVESSKTLVEDDPASIMSHGCAIDKELVKLNEIIVKLRKKDKSLTDQGCLLARIHYKTDRPNIMYMLLPTDEAGKRKYIHVGVDSEKQQQAIAKVSRYEERETVRRQIRLLHELYDQCHLQLSAMLNQLRCDVNQVTGNVDS